MIRIYTTFLLATLLIQVFKAQPLVFRLQQAIHKEKERRLQVFLDDVLREHIERNQPKQYYQETAKELKKPDATDRASEMSKHVLPLIRGSKAADLVFIPLDKSLLR